VPAWCAHVAVRTVDVGGPQDGGPSAKFTVVHTYAPYHAEDVSQYVARFGTKIGGTTATRR
jgi:hypothetical protein